MLFSSFMRIKSSLALCILTVLLLWAVVSQWFAAFSWGHDSFQMTEWLINYSGGFVRRGLPGSLIGFFADVTGAQANHLVIAFSFLCYLTLVFWFLRRASGSFPVILILSSMIMGFPAYQDSIVRKDCLGLLLLIACHGVQQSNLPKMAVMLIMNLLAGFAILSHETFAFYALAAMVLLAPGDGDVKFADGLMRRGLGLLPAVGCFLLMLVYHGTPEQAEAVNDSWRSLWLSISPTGSGMERPAAAMEALGWTTEKGLSLSIYMLTSGIYQPLAWAMVLAVTFGLLIRFTPMAIRSKVVSLLIVQLVFISPLFLLGVDYGRWIFLWIASTMIFFIGKRSAPLWLELRVERFFTNARVVRILGYVEAKDWFLLLFGIPVCWNLLNFLTASPLGRCLQLIWLSSR